MQQLKEMRSSIATARRINPSRAGGNNRQHQYMNVPGIPSADFGLVLCGLQWGAWL